MNTHRQTRPKPRMIVLRGPHHTVRWDLWFIALLALAMGLVHEPSEIAP